VYISIFCGKIHRFKHFIAFFGIIFDRERNFLLNFGIQYAKKIKAEIFSRRKFFFSLGKHDAVE